MNFERSRAFNRVTTFISIIFALGSTANLLTACDRGGAHSTVSGTAELAKPLSTGECVPFARVVKTVIEPKCKMCHGDGSANKNWTDYKMASQFGANIVDKITGTPPKMGGAPMPLVGSLSKEEKDLLKAWVQGGSKQTCSSDPADKSISPATVSVPAVPQAQSVATNCNACHGVDGHGVAATFPNLAGQSLAYIEKQLRDFRSKDRTDSFMAGIAQNLKDAEISELAKHFNSLKRNSSNAKVAAAPSEANTCVACHGTAGIADPQAMPGVPNLAGQKAEYIVKQLLAFKTQSRRDPIMQGMAASLTETQMNSIAKYFSEL